MTTLEDAWAWYRAVAAGANRLERLSKYWDSPPWGGDDWARQLERDTLFRGLDASQLRDGAETIKSELDDLAVLVLFSVFEARIRELVESQVQPEVDRLQHPALRLAGEEVIQAVTEGSFYRVLEPFKSPATHGLIEQVNQVRRYRNWVAHGRRHDKSPEVLVTPQEAFGRLKALLDVITSTLSTSTTEIV